MRSLENYTRNDKFKKCLKLEYKSDDISQILEQKE